MRSRFSAARGGFDEQLARAWCAPAAPGGCSKRTVDAATPQRRPLQGKPPAGRADRFTRGSHDVGTLAAMELDEIFIPDDTDVPRVPDSDDAVEL